MGPQNSDPTAAEKAAAEKAAAEKAAAENAAGFWPGIVIRQGGTILASDPKPAQNYQVHYKGADHSVGAAEILAALHAEYPQSAFTWVGNPDAKGPADATKQLLKSVEILQGGEPIKGAPKADNYQVRAKAGGPVLNLAAAQVVAELSAAYPGCVFTWIVK